MFLDFAGRYHTIYPEASWFHWDYGWGTVIEYADEHDYDEVFISNQYILPHYFILFYTKYSPQLYQPNSDVLVSSDLRVDSIKLGRFTVGDVRDMHFDEHSSVLVVVKPEEIDGLDTSRSYRIVRIMKSPIDYVPFVLMEPAGSISKN